MTSARAQTSREVACGGGQARRQRHARGAIDLVQRLDRTVHQHRTDRRVHPREQALRLAQAVGHQQAGAAGRGVDLPPGVDFGQHLGLRAPAVDRQAEGGFGDETVAALRLERAAGGVALAAAGAEVVARSHPDLAAMFDAHLRRTEHMPCRVQADAHPLPVQRLAPGQGLQADIAEPHAQQSGAFGAAQVVSVPGPRMVGMGMGDDGAINRAPRVDVEVADGAVQTLRAQHDQVGCVVGERQVQGFVGRHRGIVRLGHGILAQEPQP